MESLANERRATLEVAESKGTKVIDLNIASENYCNAIGEVSIIIIIVVILLLLLLSGDC